MKKLLVVGFLATLLLIAGCGKQTVQTQAVQTPSTDSEVTSVANDIADVNTLDDDLDTSDLDSLDQDLAAMQ